MRLLGAALILIGLLVAPLMPRPDIMVAQNGTLVAVRDASGKLSALPVKGSKYDLERWLEYDGDGRTRTEAQRSAAFTCDAVGCVAHVKGATVAVERHPAAVTDDCVNADVLVLDMPRPSDCTTPGTVIDVFDRWRNGALCALSRSGPAERHRAVRLETVAAHRGERPWSAMPPIAEGAAEGGRAALLPKPRILGAPEVTAPGEQSAVTKPEAAAAIEAPSSRAPPQIRTMIQARTVSRGPAIRGTLNSGASDRQAGPESRSGQARRCAS